ncbi:MAG: DUF2975 domain-containing protein [Bacteroides sp.]|nr:DUF2975 domain-containing protein [Bacillota bacterium]MCM1393722.1 DUF2975 domain-containing protein [[Eubacterium] siraeum]MCM1455240.1 DUF2975 domain-containing protein [Bacteroides sp.]
MNNKTKVIKIARGCKIASKVLYILACVACLVFVALAIALPVTNAVKTLTAAESAIMFSILALYSFLLIDFFWNTQKLFFNIENSETPFNAKSINCLKRIAWSIVVISVVPALLGSILIHAIAPNSEVVFRVELVGLISGLVLFLLAVVFSYGKDLQDRDDETL